MEALRQWRLSLPKPTLEEGAKLLGISPQQMWRYENGERQVSPSRAAEIEAITGIPRAVLRPDVFGPYSPAA